MTYDPPDLSNQAVVTGRENIMAMIRAAVGDLRTIHHGFMPEIEITGPERAEGIWAMRDEIREWDGRLVLDGSGHYHETYQLEQDRWRFSTILLTRLWLDRGPNG